MRKHDAHHMRLTIPANRCSRLAFLFLIVLTACVSRQPTDSTSQPVGQPDLNAPPTCAERGVACPGKNQLITNVRIVQPDGARPRFSPSGERIVFDRKSDEFYDVYTSDLNGNDIHSLTAGNPNINQRNNGNAIFDPSGKFIIFLSEETEHFGLGMKWLGDPGLGLFSNIWATDIDGQAFTKLTDIPIKTSIFDRTPALALVNPVFSPDGSMLIWTKRYEDGGNHNWGKWRIEAADFTIENNQPQLSNERILFSPEQGNYVTCMGMYDNQHLLLAGNLDGQHEYGMDLYTFDLTTGQTSNLTSSPDVWEEGSTVSPGGHITYMTNVDSTFKLDFSKANWAAQPVERDYWLMDLDGKDKQRLTYFNDPTAREYWGQRVLVAAADYSPDGRLLVGTLGVDTSNDPNRADVQLKIVLIEFTGPQ